MSTKTATIIFWIMFAFACLGFCEVIETIINFIN